MRMRPVSVAMLTWEYPPVVVGGLSRHVHGLARQLASDGHDVSVYTRAHAEGELSGVDDRVRLSRVAEYPPPLNSDELIPWTLAFNIGLIHRAAAGLAEDPPDVLHAHDWLVAYAGSVLKDLLGVPLVATIHATERGRHGGRLPGPTQRFIHGVERWLVSEADRVITCSAFMRDEVVESLGGLDDRIDVIRHQVDLSPFSPPAASVRDELWGEDRPVILFAGRLEFEKGVQTALEALPRIDRLVGGRPGLVVAGEGTYRPTLEQHARRLGLADRVRFEGFVDEPRLRSLYRSADVAVIPSLYEPFGLVTLEAMASETPVIAASTGGLREIVRQERNGLLFGTGDPRELAEAVSRVLTEPGLGRRLAREARRGLEETSSWAVASRATAATYGLAVAAAAARAKSAPHLSAVRETGV
jgi:glycogen(starch) synthase